MQRLSIRTVICSVSSRLVSNVLLLLRYVSRRPSLQVSCSGTAANLRRSLTSAGLAVNGLSSVSSCISHRFLPVVDLTSRETTLATRATSLLLLESRPRRNFTYRDQTCLLVDTKLAANRWSTRNVLIALGVFQQSLTAVDQQRKYFPAMSPSSCHP